MQDSCRNISAKALYTLVNDDYATRNAIRYDVDVARKHADVSELQIDRLRTRKGYEVRTVIDPSFDGFDDERVLLADKTLVAVAVTVVIIPAIAAPAP